MTTLCPVHLTPHLKPGYCPECRYEAKENDIRIPTEPEGDTP